MALETTAGGVALIKLFGVLVLAGVGATSLGFMLVGVMVSRQRWEYTATEPTGVTTGFISPTTQLILEGA